jgi:excisionase family DNA binding protein
MSENSQFKVSSESIQDIQTAVRNEIASLKETLYPKPSERKELVTRKETAQLFDVTLPTIHEWIKKGYIYPYKLGNRTYFKMSELMEVLNNSNPRAK